MYIKSSKQDQSEAYLLVFNNLRFVFLSNLNISNLQYFCQANQQKLGKTDIRFNINFLKNLPENDRIDYIVMTQYDQILSIPYLFRRNQQKNQHQIKIIATKSILQQAQIYAIDFYKNIKKMNQIIEKLSFDEQSQIQDNYEIQYGRDFKKWVTIFSKNQLLNCFKRCIAVNYGEKYNTQRGVIVTPFPSGINIGSACWIFESCLTQEKLLWIKGLSHHSWRACKQFKIDETYKKIDTIVFTQKSLLNTENPQHDQIQCLQFLKMIFQRLNINKGHNSKIILKDMLVLCDIINYIVYQFNEKFKQIFITGASINKMMCYANSFVEYLSENHQKRIYEDPPAYPFQSYEDLKQKKINEGTLTEISEVKKIPLTQLILRSTPYLHFQSNFHAYLHQQYGSVMSEKIFETRVDLNQLKKWIGNIQVSNTLYFCSQSQDLNKFSDFPQKLTFLPSCGSWGEEFRAKNKFYVSQGETGLLGKYQKKNGWIIVEHASKFYRILKENWVQIMAAQLRQSGYQVTKQKKNRQIQTLKTRIAVENFKLAIFSEDHQELIQIQKIIAKITNKIRLI